MHKYTASPAHQCVQADMRLSKAKFTCMMMTTKDHTIMKNQNHVIPSHSKCTKIQGEDNLIICLPHYCSPRTGGLQIVVIPVQSNID